MLIPIMTLVFYLTFIPHHNCRYPVHLGEWIHPACANQINQGTASTAISGKHVYTKSSDAPKPSDEEAYRYLQEVWKKEIPQAIKHQTYINLSASSSLF